MKIKYNLSNTKKLGDLKNGKRKKQRCKIETNPNQKIDTIYCIKIKKVIKITKQRIVYADNCIS